MAQDIDQGPTKENNGPNWSGTILQQVISSTIATILAAILLSWQVWAPVLVAWLRALAVNWWH